ncbi:MAG: hypothetical protein IJ030_02455 [Oscillospiraceae bacterium]|nr:hypothetical protein [Oscillospiraceae bacterium]
MKVVTNILKVLMVLAAIAGVIYVVAAYGERIVAWAKSLLTRLRGESDFLFDDEDCYYDDDCCEAAEAADFEA